MIVVDSHMYWLDDADQPICVPLSKIDQWGRWMETKENRIVKQTTTHGILVSTVFLGVDHRFGGDGPPVLWETMCFAQGERISLPRDLCVRYTSRAEAEVGHEVVIAEVEALRVTAYQDRKRLS